MARPADDLSSVGRSVVGPISRACRFVPLSVGKTCDIASEKLDL
jgi:hypothetical protein